MADEQDKGKTGARPGGQSGGGQQSGQPQGSGAGGASVPSAGARSASGNRLSGVERDKRLRTGATAGTATENAAAEYEELGVDVRLDNRLGDQRPHLNPVLKPQQIDGPEVGHFGEHADEMREEFQEALGGPAGDPVGMRSLGPLGRGEDDDEADQPTRSRAELNR
jgi:hypothetical protein